MTKKNWTMRIGAIALVVTLITCCLLGGTLARYISEVDGTATAIRALWAWEINDEALTAGTDSFTFNLFNTVNDSDGATAETDVAASRIAPGTSGSFAIKIDNVSEVNATYALDFALDNPANIPIEFSTNGTDWASTVDGASVAATPIAIGAEPATVTIQWKWAFSEAPDTANSAIDTAIGFGAETDITVTVTATFEQVD